MKNTRLHPKVIAHNKQQQQQSNQLRVKALKWLAQTYPHAFDTSTRVRPLKKGIMDDILVKITNASELPYSKAKLREAVVMFTHRMEYLSCLKNKEHRIDLDGNISEKVSEEEAKNAARLIKKRIDKMSRQKFSHDNANSKTNYSERGSSSVVIKKKVNRTLDPEKISRIRAKLGLS